MKRMVLFCLLCIFACTFGCKTSEEDSDASDTYDDMLSQYTLLTVSQIWTAKEDSNSTYNGTYIILQGVLKSIGTNSVTLVDSSTNKAVVCSFDTSIDLTSLQSALSNNSSSDDEDMISIGGVNHYSDSVDPYLESCDYFYINTDA
jgi:hypothetical protein